MNNKFDRQQLEIILEMLEDRLNDIKNGSISGFDAGYDLEISEMIDKTKSQISELKK